MPIYEYRCENGHLFEVMHKMTDPPPAECETCGAPVARVFNPVAVHFKGSGFYNTDYGTAKRKRESDAAGKASDKPGDKSQGEKSSSDGSPKSEPATAATSSSDSSGSSSSGATSSGSSASSSTPKPKVSG